VEAGRRRRASDMGQRKWSLIGEPCGNNVEGRR
jgi:hypothetical protein